MAWQPWEVVYEVMPTLPIVRAHLIFDCVLVLLTWGIVALRVTARKISGAGMGWDDYLILAAVPQGLGMLIMQGMYSQLGIGYPLTEAMHDLPIILRILAGYVFVFATSTLTIKLSVLCFYLRIFVNPAMKKASKFVMVWVSCWSLGNILQIFLICRPFAASYDPGVSGTCGNQKASFLAIGCFNALTDLAILVLPVHTIWSLHTKTGTKLSLLAIFLVGLVTTIVSIIRIVSLNSLDLSTNLTETMVYADFLSTFEVNLGILCVSLPMLGPIYHRVIGRTGVPTTTGKASGSSNGLRTFGTGPRKHYRLDDTIAAAEAGYGDKNYGTKVEAVGGSPNGSDIELTPIHQHHQQQNAIQVETEWVVNISHK